MFGAVGDGITDDTVALQSALDTLTEPGNSGTLDLEGATYLISPTQRTTATTNVHATDGHCLVVNGDRIAIENGTLLVGGYGGGPATGWQDVGGAVWRGAPIFITGTTNATAPRRGIAFRNLTIDGQTGYTGAATWPADPSTGDGWDVTHRGIWFENDRHFDDITIEDVEVRSLRGEAVFYGGSAMRTLTATAPHCHDSNGSLWSVTADQTVTNGQFHDTAADGIEERFHNRTSRFVNPTVYNCGHSGISINQDDGTTGSCEIDGGNVHHCYWGVRAQFCRFVTADGLTITDIDYRGVEVQNQSGHQECEDVAIINHTVARCVDAGIGVYPVVGGMNRITVTGNVLTDAALALPDPAVLGTGNVFQSA